MRKSLSFALGCVVWGMTVSAWGAPARYVSDLRTGWKLTVNDGTPRNVSVPNDWEIGRPRDRENLTGGAGGFAPSGIAIYTRELEVPVVVPGQRVCLEFDGVMSHAEVFVNGTKVASRPYGYVSFDADITDTLVKAGPNILRVVADTSQQPASRWYTGGGMIRPVRLVVTSATHFVKDGLVVVPQLSGDGATLALSAEVTGPDGAEVCAVITGPRGEPVAKQFLATGMAPRGDRKYYAKVTLPRVKKWELGDGQMYTARFELAGPDGEADASTVPFGIRDVRFEPETGFWVNGRNVKLKGVCLHGDGGAVGAAVPGAVWEARLRTLRDIGVNAIRTAHNPPDPEFLAVCDRMGFVVMDELFDCWRVAKNRYDYHLDFDAWSKPDITATVRRDRNHPSVVLWSAGNEIHDTPNATASKEILAGLVATFHAADPTRPVTQALFRPNVSHDYDDGLADLLDVVGQNYRENELRAAADQNPARRIVGTENGHARAAWLALRDDQRMAGQFLWSGIDYLGEAGAWPRIGSGSGLLDRAGLMKPMAYERQSWWSEKPMVYMARRVAARQRQEADPGYGNQQVTATRPRDTLFADWAPANVQDQGAEHNETVEVYSNCRLVALYLNGRSLGAQEIHDDASPRVFTVPYEPGLLRAVTDTNQRFDLRTPGKVDDLLLTRDREEVGSGMNDAAIVRAQFVDAEGTLIPAVYSPVRFEVSEGGELLGVDNGDPNLTDPFTGPATHAFRGQCMAIVRARPGAIRFTVTAIADGLPKTRVTFSTGVADTGMVVP